MGRKRSRPLPCLAALGLPEDTGGQSRITILGNRRALIENTDAIQTLTQSEIVLVGGAGRVSLFGRDLAVTDVRRDALAVEGCLRRVELGGEES